jgi:hypothetical protein
MANTDSEYRVRAVETVILAVRGQKVILDADLAHVYGVPTKALNQAVKRNADRFPSDFLFRLTEQEVDDIWSQTATTSGNRSQIVTGSQKHRDPRFQPYAFTEHGAIMAATVLNSPEAVRMSVSVERKIEGHDENIRTLFAAIRQLMTPSEPPRRQIGFGVRERRARYIVKRKGTNVPEIDWTNSEVGRALRARPDAARSSASTYRMSGRLREP